MPKIIILIPIDQEAGLTSVSLGLLRAIEQQRMTCAYFRPVAQETRDVIPGNMASMLVGLNSSAHVIASFSVAHLNHALRSEQLNLFLEEVIYRIENHAEAQTADIILVEGIYPADHFPGAYQINEALAKTSGADVILVASQGGERIIDIKTRVEWACAAMRGLKSQISGIIINRYIVPDDEEGGIGPLQATTLRYPVNTRHDHVMQVLRDCALPIIGCIPACKELTLLRAVDVARGLDASIINPGDMMTRRIRETVFCGHALSHVIDYYRPGTLLVTTADRLDIIASVSLAAMAGIEFGALLLLGETHLSVNMESLCRKAMKSGLPVLGIKKESWQVSQKLAEIGMGLPVDDSVRIRNTSHYIAGYIDCDWLARLKHTPDRRLPLTPSLFRYRIAEMARQTVQRIILPEGEEIRTIQAATICAERGLATCILLGKPERVRRIAEQSRCKISKSIIIIDPDSIREKYLDRLVALRAGKGMDEVKAREKLMDPNYLGTMMLENGDADGLVSGAGHTTAMTLTPPLQIIKTAPGVSGVSSVFFMLLPDRVLVYGDCAVNPCPDAQQLADIAIQSAQTAQIFGIEPRVAMISWSTGESGQGSSVDKVREATRIARRKSPGLVIDGPLQYDAAVVRSVAMAKAPCSPVAGNATVIIFPDLNTGNTAYKAVQRSADVVAMGPVLQGMRKPVNDLSRGALVDDIVYTIALTAIQAQQVDKVARETTLTVSGECIQSL